MNFPVFALTHMASSLTRSCAIWVCLLLFASAAWADSEHEGRLRLLLRDSAGATLFAIPVQEGDIFAITYTHSVAQTPVTDYFLIKEKAIWLEGSVYHDFGAGLPHTPEHGQQLRQEQGRLIMSGYNKRLGSFDLRVGRVAGHELVIFTGHDRNLAVDKVLPLDSLAPGGGVINFSIEAT